MLPSTAGPLSTTLPVPFFWVKETNRPQAIPDFMASIQSTDSLQVKRALLALLYIVKELSTARLTPSRRQLQVYAPEIIAVVGDIYARTVERWRNGEIDQMEVSLLAIELLGRLLIAGYEHPNRDATAASFWSLTIEHLAAFIPLLNSITPEVSPFNERRILVAISDEAFERVCASVIPIQVLWRVKLSTVY